MTKLQKGDLVITSRSRYGTVVDIKNENGYNKYLIKIGANQHWIDEDQLMKAVDTIRLQVVYQWDYCGKPIIESTEVALKKKTVLFDINHNGNILLEECKSVIEKQTNQKVEIKTISIS